jgi:hypothetical protein
MVNFNGKSCRTMKYFNFPCPPTPSLSEFLMLPECNYTICPENSKHILPEKEYQGLSPNFHTLSVSDLLYFHDGSAYSAE